MTRIKITVLGGRVYLIVGDTEVALSSDDALKISHRLNGAALHTDRPYLDGVTLLEVTV